MLHKFGILRQTITSTFKGPPICGEFQGSRQIKRNKDYLTLSEISVAVVLYYQVENLTSDTCFNGINLT